MPVTASSSSLARQDDHTATPLSNKPSPAGLAPSTVSQWLPEQSSSGPSENQTATGGTLPPALAGVESRSLENSLTSGPDEKDPRVATGIASGSAAAVHPSAPKEILSTSPETVSGTAPEVTVSTKPEAVPASASEVAAEKAPYVVPQATPSIDPEKVGGPAPEATTSAIAEEGHSTDPEKIPTSSYPPPNGKGSPASSDLEKEIDLEAGHRSEDSNKKKPETTKPDVDPDIVDWDGPEDPQNPVNWSEKLKWANVAVIASITFLT